MSDNLNDLNKKNPMKVIFGEAIERVKRLGNLPVNYVGKIVLNCNNGGITSIEKTETIR